MIYVECDWCKRQFKSLVSNNPLVHAKFTLFNGEETKILNELDLCVDCYNSIRFTIDNRKNKIED